MVETAADADDVAHGRPYVASRLRLGTVRGRQPRESWLSAGVDMDCGRALVRVWCTKDSRRKGLEIVGEVDEPIGLGLLLVIRCKVMFFGVDVFVTQIAQPLSKCLTPWCRTD